MDQTQKFLESHPVPNSASLPPAEVFEQAVTTTAGLISPRLNSPLSHTLVLAFVKESIIRFKVKNLPEYLYRGVKLHDNSTVDLQNFSFMAPTLGEAIKYAKKNPYQVYVYKSLQPAEVYDLESLKDHPELIDLIQWGKAANEGNQEDLKLMIEITFPDVMGWYRETTAVSQGNAVVGEYNIWKARDQFVGRMIEIISPSMICVQEVTISTKQKQKCFSCHTQITGLAKQYNDQFYHANLQCFNEKCSKCQFQITTCSLQDANRKYVPIGCSNCLTCGICSKALDSPKAFRIAQSYYCTQCLEEKHKALLF